MILKAKKNSEDKFIGLYNRLHKKLSELEKPHFQEVADGVIIDKFTDPRTAQHHLKDGFISLMKAVHVAKKQMIFSLEEYQNSTKIH